MRVGVIGCGSISSTYLENSKRFEEFEIVGCADKDMNSAITRCDETKIGNAVHIEELLADETIDLVINLTPPSAHVKVSTMILEAGKHLYSEKPIALTSEEGQKLIQLAEWKRLKIGCAPDTFLGAACQTAKKIIESGKIGEPTSFIASMTCPGHERWHPNPEFYYKKGGGPLFDMGPYYLSALVELLGNITHVCAVAKKGSEKRIIKTGPRAGTSINVEVATHVQTLLTCNQKIFGTMLMSFDVWNTHLPHIEIYGTHGTLKLPDPNFFGGPLELYVSGREEWEVVDPVGIYQDNNRGVGIADMCKGIKNETSYKADAHRALHIVRVMESILESSKSGGQITLP